MADDAVTRISESMDELDFTGWNGADWDGAFRDTTPRTFS